MDGASLWITRKAERVGEPNRRIKREREEEAD